MIKEKTKVYLYTRVSTSMQIAGYSLDAQKSRMKSFCEFNDYEIVGEYEDAGKSGKSVEGRVAFKSMMEAKVVSQSGYNYKAKRYLMTLRRRAKNSLSNRKVIS